MGNTVPKRDKLLKSFFHGENLLLISAFVKNSTTGWALMESNSQIIMFSYPIL